MRCCMLRASMQLRSAAVVAEYHDRLCLLLLEVCCNVRSNEIYRPDDNKAKAVFVVAGYYFRLL